MWNILIQVAQPIREISSKEADRDPDNPDNVLGIYSAFSMDGEC